MTKIDEITARLNAASEGPWTVDGEHLRAMVRARGLEIVCVRHRAGADQNTADMAFIANAPTDIAYLLAEVKRLNEECQLSMTEIANLRHDVERAMQNCVDEANANDKLRHEVNRLSAPVTDDEIEEANERHDRRANMSFILTAFLKGRMS